MKKYETPETPGASNPDGHQSGVRQLLNDLTRSRITANNAQAYLLNFQLEMARRCADNIAALEVQLPTAKDNQERRVLCDLINEQFQNMVAVLFDLAPDKPMGNETDN
jgi:hypothetical protein